MGLWLLAVGDLLQLNPVGESPVYLNLSHSLSNLAGNLWTKLFKMFELHEIVRQKNDPDFSELLNRMRTGNSTPDDIVVLQKLEANNVPEDCIHLFLTNAEVDSFNAKKNQKLNSPLFLINSKDTKQPKTFKFFLKLTHTS